MDHNDPEPEPYPGGYKFDPPLRVSPDPMHAYYFMTVPTSPTGGVISDGGCVA